MYKTTNTSVLPRFEVICTKHCCDSHSLPHEINTKTHSCLHHHLKSFLETHLYPQAMTQTQMQSK